MNSGSNSVQIIPNRLYWISDRTPPRNQANAFYFNIDAELTYQPFCSDFGPLNLASTYKFCIQLQKLLKNPQFANYRIFHYTSMIPAKKANSATLMGAYQILVLKRSAQQAWQKFLPVGPFLDYRDAGYGGCTYKCTILHVLRGLQKAVDLGWFNLQSFNLQQYEYYQKVQNGDWNWIVPNKLLAFACPSSVSIDQDGFRVWTPQDFSPLFKDLEVSAVVRLNNKTYDQERFKRHDINFYDIFFRDGSCPSENIVQVFLSIAEQEKAVAVHCKAGLGRTGTLIGCYCMKHFGFKAADFIGWARLCRPGSVLGPQQQFLVEMEEQCYRWGAENRVDLEMRGEERKIEMSPEEERVKVYGDKMQAERLVQAKKTNQNPDSPLRLNRK